MFNSYISCHTYKGYKIYKITRKDYFVADPKNESRFLAHCMTLKAAKEAINSL